MGKVVVAVDVVGNRVIAKLGQHLALAIWENGNRA